MRSSTFNFTVLFLLAAVSAFACCSVTYEKLNIGPGAGTGGLCSGHDVALGCEAPGTNPVPANHLDIYNSSADTVDITRLIIGIPLATGVHVGPSALTLPQITGVDIYNPYPGSHSAGSPLDPGAHGCGVLTSSSLGPYNSACTGQSVNLGGAENWGNWSAAANNAAEFALYYYDLQSLTNPVGSGLYDIFLGAGLPAGTIEIAFGLKQGGGDAYCYLTGWNQAGQVVPEPASWLMVAGAGLAFLGGRRFKKNRS